MNFFDSFYTLIEIAINNNIEKKRIRILSNYLNAKRKDKISVNFPELAKFLPYCDWYIIREKNMLCMSAYYYDLYKSTGLLPNIEDVDKNPDINKLEHWQYINPLIFEINPETDFEFAEKVFPNCDIWNLFLSGCARMDYYEGKTTSTEQRIKYAMVEYMIRRTQFFTTEDFVDNEILHKKYNKEYDKKEKIQEVLKNKNIKEMKIWHTK